MAYYYSIASDVSHIIHSLKIYAKFEQLPRLPFTQLQSTCLI